MKNNILTIQDGLIDTPLISIALPVYNGKVYLADAIDSILAQTFKNFELIIIDDGSTDCSLEILRRYQALDNRIVLISRENKNLVNTLNEALKISKGKWFARMDQDDIALPHRLERQLLYLESTGADVCGSMVNFIGSGNRNTLNMYVSDRAIKVDMLFRSPFVHPSVMMRTELAAKLRYDLAFDKAEDYDLWVRGAEYGWKMANVPEVLLLYRIHDDQTTAKFADTMQNLRSKIQKRFWNFTTKKSGLGLPYIQQVLYMINGKEADLKVANKLFGWLLSQYVGEARQALVNNINRLYLKASLRHQDAYNKWLELGIYSKFYYNYWFRFKFLTVYYFVGDMGNKRFDFFKKLYNSYFRK